MLFLDEAPEFGPASLDALRQPLESGVITVSRAAATARFPARFQLVLAANPCPCGNAGARDTECTCTAFTRRRYLGRLSGPLLDRIDIQLNVPRITSAQLRMAGSVAGTDSATARARVAAARAVAAERLRATPWRLNSHVSGSWLRSPAGAPAPDPRRLSIEPSNAAASPCAATTAYSDWPGRSPTSTASIVRAKNSSGGHCF